MPRITPFSVGQVWRRKEVGSPYTNKGYFWVILHSEKDTKADEKRVLMGYDPFGPNIHKGDEHREAPPRIYTFKHKHIKKYAVPFDRATFDKAQEADALLIKKLEEISKNLNDHYESKGPIGPFENRWKKLELEAWRLWGEYHKIVMGAEAWEKLNANDKWAKEVFQ